MSPSLTSGTLALVGSGEYLPAMDAVDRLLLDRVGGSPRVVCLPTAAGGEGADSVSKWSRLGVDHFTRLGVQVEAVEVIDRRSADDEANADKIRAANFVYLSGGKPDYLHKSLKDSKAWAAICSVLERGGVVAGCSAGAMIWGEHTFSFPTLWPRRPMFNHLPGVMIMPHFDELSPNLRRAIKFVAGGHTLVGIDGSTALVRGAGRFTAHGSGAVTVWNRHQARFTNGQDVVLESD